MEYSKNSAMSCAEPRSDTCERVGGILTDKSGSVSDVAEQMIKFCLFVTIQTSSPNYNR